MLVHLVGSRYNIVNSIDSFRRMVEAIHEEEHTLARDWVEPTYVSQKKENKSVKDIDWVLVHRDSLEAINKADVVIADSTTPSFSVGYQVAMSVQMKKPTLVLNREGVEESFFAEGIENGIIYKKYAKDNLKSIIKSFLKENDIQAKDMRFNFFIDRPIYNYLRWAAYKTGKTKAEILRDLVTKEIDKSTDINQL